MGNRIGIDSELAARTEHVPRQEMQWTCSPPTPPEASSTPWRHQYLPTHRLHVGQAPLSGILERHSTGAFGLSEEQLDSVFAVSVEFLWARYSGRVLEDVRKAQEEGLASILRAVLSPAGRKTGRRARRLSAATAYDRVESFLKRQQSALALPALPAFEVQYRENLTLQDIVKDIDSVETKIEEATRQRDKLQDLIGGMFLANKTVRFTDRSIEVSAISGESIGLASLSSGEKHLLRILVASLLAEDNALIIDEPEISMHVDWQKSLIASVRAVNSRAQLILATHSPEIMADLPDEKIFRI